MKKLILAPAVALAFTGLVASPVVAAEPPTAPAKSSESAAAAADGTTADKDAESADGKDSTAQKKAPTSKKTASPKTTGAPEAPKNATTDSPEATAKKPQPTEAPTKKPVDKPAEKPTDEPNPVAAQLTVITDEVSAENFANPEVGAKVKITNLESGDTIKDSETATTHTADSSAETITVYSHEEPTPGQSADFTVTVQRQGEESKTLKGSVQIAPLAELDASLEVIPDEVTAADLSDETKGVELRVSGVEAGDTVEDSLTGKTSDVTDSGTFSTQVYYTDDPADLDPGPISVTVTVTRGDDTQKLTGTINVVEAVEDASLTAADEITLEDFTSAGLPFKGKGFEPGSAVTVTLPDQQGAQYEKKITAGEDGTIAGTVKVDGLTAGTYTLEAYAEGESEEPAASHTFTITEDSADDLDASLEVIPEKITAKDMADEKKGIEVRVSGVMAGDTVTDSLTGKSDTVTEDGTFSKQVYWTGDASELESGPVNFTVTVSRGEGEATQEQKLKGTVTIVDEDSDNGKGDNGKGDDDGKDDSNKGDDSGNKGKDAPAAPAAASLAVSPQTLEAADFVNKDKGVTLSVENCAPGVDVRFQVNPAGSDVAAYDTTEQADKNGKASVTVFGTTSHTAAYVGNYNVAVTCGDDAMNDSFTVTGGATGGGSTGDGAGNGSNNNLPRTGIELGGLTAGALLLLVGGAAIAVTTSRRKSTGKSPTDV